jgi:glutamate 5-kinase
VLVSWRHSAGQDLFQAARRPLKLEESQAAARRADPARHAYQESLARHGITVAQILLTLDDSEAAGATSTRARPWARCSASAPCR